MTSATTLFFCAATSRCLSVETTYKPSKLSLILLKLPLDSARLCNVEQVVAQVIVDFPILFDIFIAIGDVWEIFAHTACILSMLLRALARVCTSEKERKKERGAMNKRRGLFSLQKEDKTLFPRPVSKPSLPGTYPSRATHDAGANPLLPADDRAGARNKSVSLPAGTLASTPGPISTPIYCTVLA